jgi:two-component system chemotaxis sensor kinase CheA
MEDKDKDFLQRIQATFRIEAEEHINAFSFCLNELENSQSKESHARMVETMFREVHSLKGAARSVGQKEIESVCQPLEKLFSMLKKQEIKLLPPMVDLFYKCNEYLRTIVISDRNVQFRDGHKDLDDLIIQINTAVSGIVLSENKALQTQHYDLIQAKITLPEKLGKEPVKGVTKNKKPSNPEAVRIRISKLNPLLLQAEEFIQSKIAFKQLVHDLNFLVKEISELKTDSRKMRVRKSMPSVAQWNEWQNGNELQLSNLEDHMIKIIRLMEKEGYNFDRMVDDLLDTMKQVLLLPVSSLTEAFPVMVREISRNLKKDIDFNIKGSELEIDKRILEELKDPLIHLIRNSIDHGIELTEERQLHGKSTHGKITLSFSAKESGLFEILVTDDGKGINEGQVITAALNSGILTDEIVSKLKREEILSLIYQSGFSTSKIITDLSGHGLGLTIVKEKVEKLNGSISVDSQPNKGTSFRIILPMTLTTFRGIMVSLGEFLFFIPTIHVKMALRVKPEEITTVENHDTIRIGNDILSVVNLADTLGIQERRNGKSVSKSIGSLDSDFIKIVVLGYAERRLAFRVDDVLEEQQVLVKGLGGLLYRVRNISGATILGSGKIVPILNIADLMKSGIGTSLGNRKSLVEENLIIKSGKILIAEDSITSRTLLKNILETAGYQVTTAVDGLDAYTKAKSGDFDLIVSDVDMPRMNGFELTLKIKSDQKLNETPVVLVTALESREDRERGIEAGANAYIIKSSFDQGNLLEVIRKLI